MTVQAQAVCARPQLKVHQALAAIMKSRPTSPLKQHEEFLKVVQCKLNPMLKAPGISA